MFGNPDETLAFVFEILHEGVQKTIRNPSLALAVKYIFFILAARLRNLFIFTGQLLSSLNIVNQRPGTASYSVVKVLTDI